MNEQDSSNEKTELNVEASDLQESSVVPLAARADLTIAEDAVNDAAGSPPPISRGPAGVQ